MAQEETPSATAQVSKLVDRLTPRRYPSVLYHYTTANGLIGIVETGTIWATNVKYLNDATEFSLALDMAKSVIAEHRRTTRYSFEVGLYEVLQDSLTTAAAEEVYVSSFSEHGDQLSQWRGYTTNGAGYSLGIAAAELAKLNRSVSRRFLCRCIYQEEKQVSLIGEIVRNVEAFAGQLYGARGISIDRVYREAFKLLAAMLPLAAPVIKHPTFSEEAEWRLVSLSSSFEDSHPRIRSGRSTLVPFYHHSIRGQTGSSVIKDLVIGPTPNAHLAQQAVHELLDRWQIHPKVRLSQIPYRNW